MGRDEIRRFDGKGRVVNDLIERSVALATLRDTNQNPMTALPLGDCDVPLEA